MVFLLVSLVYMMVSASGLLLFHSAFMLISSRVCQRHLTQHYGDSTPRSGGVILPTLSPLIKPFVYRLLLFDTSCPCSLSSRLFLPCHLWLPPRSHPPPLCPLTTWHLFRFIPISWQTACISPGGHNAAILANQWQINQCYLFFPCLCCHRFFFFCYFAVCGDLNFAQLNWVHFQEQIATA